MRLPNFYEFEPLNSAKERMGIPRNVYGSLTVPIAVGRLTELELEKLTSPNGLDISGDELTILPDGTLAYKNSRVILYIRDITVYKKDEEIRPRFHLANCATLQQMREYNRFDRYVVSVSTNGWFDINVIDSGITRKMTCELYVCQNCLNLLNFDGFMMKWSQSERLSFVRHFKIDRFFEKYLCSLHHQIPKYNSDNAPLDIYSDDFEEISQRVRSDCRWCCQRCGVNLSEPANRKWLHVHHKNGLKHDNARDNLEAICIGCHAEEPNHRHIRNSRDYNEFFREKYRF